MNALEQLKGYADFENSSSNQNSTFKTGKEKQ